MQTMKPTGTLYRSASLLRTSAGDRTVELSFASAAPVPRPWGLEVLKVTPEAVRLGRIQTEGPVLIDHDTSRMVGKVQSCWLEGERARASVRFGTSTLAQEAWDDVQGGIRTGVSFGYIVHAMEEITGPSDQERTFLVTDWEPIEITLATIPADVSVGVNRSLAAPREGVTMETNSTNNTKPNDGAAAERARTTGILELAAKRGEHELAQRYISEGRSVSDFQRALFDRMDTMNQPPLPRATLGLSPRDVERFSVLRAIKALAYPTERRVQEEAAHEREVSRAYAERAGRAPRGLFVPHEVMRRDITKAGSGGNLVGTDHLAGDFIGMLRAKTVALKLGRLLAGLRGDVAIPRQASGAAASWVAEGDDVPEQAAVFDQVTMSPKSCGAFSVVSRKMLLQSSPDADMLVQEDLATAVGHAIDAAAINGSGSGSTPRGILQTTGVGLVPIGDNGGIPTWPHIVDLESAVATADADVPSMAYLTTPGIRGHFKTKPKVDGQAVFCWENPVTMGAGGVGGAVQNDGMLNGYPAFVSNQVPRTLDKGTSVGVCHAIIHGDFSSLVVGLWDGVDITLDPFTSATKGALRVVVFQDADIVLRHPESFAVVVDAIPA
ncbi:MAG TPA: phage major capsid protein [Candidatus Krumholzibacteria bacterium]|nr:phage major capsid protein [Candidatus Krumholzibacteria bacterium]HRX51139.1 phage major capsid protein [Candidatus Krumholzibacteria bacterium]